MFFSVLHSAVVHVYADGLNACSSELQTPVIMLCIIVYYPIDPSTTVTDVGHGHWRRFRSDWSAIFRTRYCNFIFVAMSDVYFLFSLSLHLFSVMGSVRCH